MANGIGNNRNTAVGNQLARRVKSGAITGKQAQRTTGQRALLEKAFGSNWRVKVYGSKEGAKGLPSYGYAGGSEVNELREKALARAKAKLATPAPKGNGKLRTNPLEGRKLY